MDSTGAFCMCATAKAHPVRERQGTDIEGRLQVWDRLSVSLG